MTAVGSGVVGCYNWSASALPAGLASTKTTTCAPSSAPATQITTGIAGVPARSAGPGYAKQVTVTVSAVGMSSASPASPPAGPASTSLIVVPTQWAISSSPEAYSGTSLHCLLRQRTQMLDRRCLEKAIAAAVFVHDGNAYHVTQILETIPTSPGWEWGIAGQGPDSVAYDRTLVSVSCPSVSSCVAVGSWYPQSTPNGSQVYLLVMSPQLAVHPYFKPPPPPSTLFTHIPMLYAITAILEAARPLSLAPTARTAAASPQVSPPPSIPARLQDTESTPNHRSTPPWSAAQRPFVHAVRQRLADPSGVCSWPGTRRHSSAPSHRWDVNGRLLLGSDVGNRDPLALSAEIG